MLGPDVQQALEEANAKLGPRGKRHFGIAGDGIPLEEHRRRTLWRRLNFMDWDPDETDPAVAFRTNDSFVEGLYNRMISKDPCVYCGKLPNSEARLTISRDRDSNTKDHIRPKSQGYDLVWTNKAPACARCNRRKGAMSVLEFLQTRRERPARSGTVRTDEGSTHEDL